jgi:sigma-B regulation protein RsbU (phosphoserine phosphatase)
MKLKRKALIADDERIAILALERLLTDLDFEVSTAQNGREAWPILLEERPSLIILDWVMPLVDGLELCKRIRAAQDTFERTPYIIALSSKDGGEQKARFLAAGADDYVTKPFDRLELSARIEAGWRRLVWEEETLSRQKVK